MMIAALATLVFLTTLWLLTVVGAKVLEESGSKILVALKGKSVNSVMSTAPQRLRHRERYRTAYRATPRLRAAA
ncbi:MAG: hypothetical protein H0W71_00340 [Sphingomonas sp.]|nr:hypothetical protein [Sphingomonas sp.]